MVTDWWLVAVYLSPLLAIPAQRIWWWHKNRQWKRAVDRWADATERGIDSSLLLKDCPDIGRALGRRGP